MIKLIIGGIGQGKTVTAIKHIIDRNNKCYCNFPVKHEKAVRLRTDHILKEDETTTSRGKVSTKLSINWDFWNEEMKKEPFDIYIDEAHNVANSRRSLSKWNTLFTQWITQIRKVLGDSEKNHLYMVTQRISGIDVVIRDLAAEIILLEKWQSNSMVDTAVLRRGKRIRKLLNKTWVIMTRFSGTYCMDKLNFYMNGSGKYDSKSYFLANYYFQFYDSYEIVRFGESVYV